MRLAHRQALAAWGFLILPLFFFAAVRFWPALDAMMLSLSQWNLVGPRRFAGLDNYMRLAADPEFWKVLGNTFLYLALGLPVSLGLAFLIAYHLDRLHRMHALLRALYFLPHLTT